MDWMADVWGQHRNDNSVKGAIAWSRNHVLSSMSFKIDHSLSSVSHHACFCFLHSHLFPISYHLLPIYRKFNTRMMHVAREKLWQVQWTYLTPRCHRGEATEVTTTNILQSGFWIVACCIVLFATSLHT